MDIILKNKFVYYKDYKAKCAIGKRGIALKKKEGDKRTPKGRFKLKYILYRKDRINNISTKLKLVPIRKNFGWCDDPSTKHYNKLVKLPVRFNTEKLYLNNNTYDIIVVIDYNLNPVKKNKGSAIFLHIAKKNYSPTLGCVALSKNNLKYLLSIIKKNTFIKIF